MDFGQIKKKLLVSLILGVVIIVALSVYSDFNKLVGSLFIFDFRYLPLILVLAPLNYFFRYIKWSYYLRLLKIDIDRRDNLRVFISGLAMTVTPGKIGEFLKAYLIKELTGVPVSVTSPLILIERLTDGISMILLASLGALRFRYGLGVLVFSLSFVALFIVFVRFKAFAEWSIALFKKLPVLKKLGTAIDSFYHSSYRLLDFRSLVFSVAIGTVSWAFEGVIIYLTLKAFSQPISILTSVFIVSFATIVGAVTMLPGGLVAAEGSIMGLLVMMNVPKELASAATIVTRFSTLWLGVAIGILGLISMQRRLKKGAA